MTIRHWSRNFFFISAFLTSAASFGGSAEAYRFSGEMPTHVLEIGAKTREERTRLANLGYALDEVHSDRVYVFAAKRDAARIRKAGFKVTLSPYKQEWATQSELGPDAARYTSYNEVKTQLQDLAAANPNIVTLMSLGNSTQNRDMPLIRISGKSLGDADAARLPVAFYLGCHHAREHLSVEVPLLWAKYLASEYGKNPDVTRLVDSREIYIAPVVNPDGHVYDYTNGVQGRMWRKNRRDNGRNTFGVDLNRNYGFQWGTGGSSTNPSSDVYMGTAPFSEPETQNVKAFIDSQSRMTVLLTFHTFSELILYPWGHTEDNIGQGLGNAADLPVFEKMATDMASWNHYTPQQASDLYVASGDTTDYAYGQHGIFAFTFELTPTSMFQGGFYPNPSVVEPTFQANLRPMMYLLEYADNPARTLHAPAPQFTVTPSKRGLAVASFGDVNH